MQDMALKWLQSRSLVLSGAFITTAVSVYEDVSAFIRSTPSTIRIVIWSVQSGLKYKQLMSKHVDHNSEQYVEQLRLLHTQLATLLLHVCKQNGGVYIKTGQFAGAFGAVPREYRCDVICS
jgi:aarF domain-containing kinase